MRLACLSPPVTSFPHLIPTLILYPALSTVNGEGHVRRRLFGFEPSQLGHTSALLLVILTQRKHGERQQVKSKPHIDFVTSCQRAVLPIVTQWLTCFSSSEKNCQLLYFKMQSLILPHFSKEKELQPRPVTHTYSSPAEDLTYIFKSGRLVVIREVTRVWQKRKRGVNPFFTLHLSPKAGDYISMNANSKPWGEHVIYWNICFSLHTVWQTAGMTRMRLLIWACVCVCVKVGERDGKTQGGWQWF